MRSLPLPAFLMAGFLFGVSFYHFVIIDEDQCSLQYVPLSHFIQDEKDTITSPPIDASTSVSLSFEEVLKGPLDQDDPRLLSHIRDTFLFPPSPAPYNLTRPKVKDPSMGQAKMVLKALNRMRNGFFVEAGALDGELRSNTLVLEKDFGWTGLLVEPDPNNFAPLRLKRRKAWSSPTCLSIHPYPQKVMFEQFSSRGRISSVKVDSSTGPSTPHPLTPVQCFPLFSLLASLNISTVDYFSLDVEGSELQVLQTIPFHQLRIRALSVEWLHTPGGREGIKRFLTSKGYRLYGEVQDPIKNWAYDLIFLHQTAFTS